MGAPQGGEFFDFAPSCDEPLLHPGEHMSNPAGSSLTTSEDQEIGEEFSSLRLNHPQDCTHADSGNEAGDGGSGWLYCGGGEEDAFLRLSFQQLQRLSGGVLADVVQAAKPMPTVLGLISNPDQYHTPTGQPCLTFGHGTSEKHFS